MNNVVEFPKSRIVRELSIVWEPWSCFKVIKKLFVKSQGADAWEQWLCYGSGDGKSSFWGPADLFESEGSGLDLRDSS